MISGGGTLDQMRGTNDLVEVSMRARALAIAAAVAGTLFAAGAADAREWDRGGLGRPQWAPPTHAQPYGQREAWFGDRDRGRAGWRDDDRGRRGHWREPPGHHYGWFRNHHRDRHDHRWRDRRWWD